MSEFCVDVETEKQVKQNYKHEAHLLVLNNHFVVPVLDSPDLGMDSFLDMVEVRRHLVLDMLVAETMAVAAARKSADTAALVGCRGFAAVEDSVRNLWMEVHSQMAETLVLEAGCKSAALQKWS